MNVTPKSRGQHKIIRLGHSGPSFTASSLVRKLSVGVGGTVYKQLTRIVEHYFSRFMRQFLNDSSWQGVEILISASAPSYKRRVAVYVAYSAVAETRVGLVAGCYLA